MWFEFADLSKVSPELFPGIAKVSPELSPELLWCMKY
jgi:hypothetical protein